jgi:hypothetical protein
MNYDIRVIEVARAVLARKMGIIESSRRMVSLKSTLNLHHDELFNVFVRIDSETDNLILDMSKFQMTDSHMRENIKDIEKYENFYRGEIEQVCNEIISIAS